MANDSSSGGGGGGGLVSIYEDHPGLFRGFALVYGMVLFMAGQSLLRAFRADRKRWTIQKILLCLVVGVCGARCVAYLGHVDLRLHYFIQHLFNAIVYWSFFSFYTVLLFFLHEFSRINSSGTSKFRGLSFLYPIDMLSRAKPTLVYTNGLIFLYTYFSLCMIHMQPAWAFLPVIIGSMLHAIIYFALSVNFWSHTRLFSRKQPSATTVRLGTSVPVWWIPWCLSLCLFVQSALTVMPLFWMRFFFENFIVFHTAFIVAELMPLVLILSILQESTANYFVTAAAAA